MLLGIIRKILIRTTETAKCNQREIRTLFIITVSQLSDLKRALQFFCYEITCTSAHARLLKTKVYFKKDMGKLLENQGILKIDHTIFGCFNPGSIFAIKIVDQKPF
jgi:hypothetical protein